MSDKIWSAGRKGLAQLLGLDQSDRCPFSPAELSASLQQQLVKPREFEREEPPASDETRSVEKTRSGAPPVSTFKDLLHHPKAPLKLLERAKEYAKTCDRLVDAPVPIEVATLLYYAFIAAGLVYHNIVISETDLGTLRQGFHWCLQQAWVDGETKTLIKAGLAGTEKTTIL